MARPRLSQGYYIPKQQGTDLHLLRVHLIDSNHVTVCMLSYDLRCFASNLTSTHAEMLEWWVRRSTSLLLLSARVLSFAWISMLLMSASEWKPCSDPYFMGHGQSVSLSVCQSDKSIEAFTHVVALVAMDQVHL